MRVRQWTTERTNPKIWDTLDYQHTVELLEPFRRRLATRRLRPRDVRSLTRVMFGVLMPDAMEASWQGIEIWEMELANKARTLLKPYQLNLLRMIYTHGESIAFVQDVAAHYGAKLSDKAVQSRIARAKEALFKAVEDVWQDRGEH